MNKFCICSIKKEDFLKIKEDDVLFITNPGRMGDEDGITFVLEKGNNYLVYRLDGFLYPNNKECITLKDAIKQFPRWYKSWQHINKDNYQEKYKYLYMGLGNGLYVDKKIYNDFKPYLEEKVKEYLNDYDEDDKNSLQYAVIFNVWKEALEKMIDSKKI